MDRTTLDLSIVIPIKDERDNLTRLHDAVTGALAAEKLDYEIILVDDGSSDGSFDLMRQIAARDPRFKVVRLKRNFGQSAALQAGLDAASGDVIATMDGDLQNDPADIPMLLAKLNEGYDGVFGIRAKRQDHLFIRKIPSKLGNWVIRKVTGSTMLDLGCTLRVMRKDLAKSLTLYGEMHRFISVMAQQAGYRLIQVPVRHHPRTAGKTKYTLSRTFRVMLDLITVKFLHSYVTRPMHIMGLAGIASIFFGFVFLIITVLMKVFQGQFMTGNPFLLLSTILVVIGVQFISLGLIGELMSRTYFESQGKRPYTVGERLNMDEDERQRRAA
ncbi:MAG: glycosyltransferase family 2 protein [Gemmataceae bacterium]